MSAPDSGPHYFVALDFYGDPAVWYGEPDSPTCAHVLSSRAVDRPQSGGAWDVLTSHLPHHEGTTDQ